MEYQELDVRASVKFLILNVKGCWEVIESSELVLSFFFTVITSKKELLLLSNSAQISPYINEQHLH